MVPDSNPNHTLSASSIPSTVDDTSQVAELEIDSSDFMDFLKKTEDEIAKRRIRCSRADLELSKRYEIGRSAQDTQDDLLILKPVEGDVAILEQWMKDIAELKNIETQFQEQVKSYRMEDNSRVKELQDAFGWYYYDWSTKGLRNLHQDSYGHLLDMTTEPDLTCPKGQYTLGRHLSGEKLEAGSSVFQLLVDRDGEEKVLGYLKPSGALERINAAHFASRVRPYHLFDELDDEMTHVENPGLRREINDRESLGSVIRVRHGTISSRQTGLGFDVTLTNDQEATLDMRKNGIPLDNWEERKEWFTNFAAY